MKKLVKLLSLCTVFAVAVFCFACSPIEEGDVLSAEAQTFITSVNELGDITLESDSKLSDSYTLYENLTTEDKKVSEVVNAKTLLDEKKAVYNKLVAEKAANDFIVVANEIPALDLLTKEDLAKIEMAEALYNALSEEAKKVEGVSEAYAKVQAAREKLEAPSDNAIAISTAEEFMAIANDLTAEYKLVNDIDMSGTPWTVLGEFSGRLNGNGYTVKNLQYEHQASGFAIFQKIAAEGIVERLGVTGYVEDAGSWIGTICVENNGTIRNCFTNVYLKSKDATSYAGLIALKNLAQGRIENCLTTGVNACMATEWNLSKGVMVFEADAASVITGSYALKDNNEIEYAVGNTKDTTMLKTLDELKKASLYEGWDTEIWNIEDGKLPQLKNEKGSTLVPTLYIANSKTSFKESELSDGKITIRLSAIDCDPANVELSLKEVVDGVTLENGVVTITKKGGLVFTVVATLKGTEVKAEQQFTIIAESNAVTVSTADEFIAIGNDLGGEYVLANDIDMAGKPWTVLGEFTGHLNGNGYTIKNIQYEHQASGFAIFSKLANGSVVERLGLTGFIADAADWSGAICVENRGTIKNCFTNLYIKAEGPFAYGGLICLKNLPGGVIENCLTTGVNACMGTEWSLDKGVIALEANPESQIIGSYALKDNNEHIYGIGNTQDATMLKTVNELKSASLYETWDKNIWNIEEGKIPQLKNEKGSANTPVIYITNSKTSFKDFELANGKINVKAVVTDGNYGDVTFSLKQPVEGVEISADGVVTVSAKGGVTFTVVVSLNGTEAKVEQEFNVIAESNATKISTAEELLAIAKDETSLGGEYELANDISLANVEWQAIDNFAGRLNGKGFTIRDFKFTPQYVGFALFKTVKAGAIVENLVIEGNIENAGSWFGGFVIDNFGTIRNCIANMTVKGVNNDAYGGGIACNNKPSGVIANCISKSNITSKAAAFPDVSCGGIVVGNEGKITNCYVDKDASGMNVVVGNNKTALTEMLKTSEELKNAKLFSDWDKTVWTITEGQYPQLTK